MSCGKTVTKAYMFKWMNCELRRGFKIELRKV